MGRDSTLIAQDSADPPAKNERTWYLLSSHGIAYFYIAANPDCTIRNISETLFLSRRTVWGLVGDLRRAKMIEVRREGRRHHYTAKLDAKLQHPTFAGTTVRDMLRRLTEG